MTETTEIYGRPAEIRAIYGDVAEVYFTDINWTKSYVPVDHIDSN